MPDLFETVIGLEIHVQMNTKSKMFCSCSNDSFGKEANINTCPICMGFPGTLPVLNEETLHKGIKTALALNCNIPNESKFDRKNYFYPDLPKAYQISQYDLPISVNGHLDIRLSNGEVRKIGITRLHLEEDAGKLSHVGNSTLCDFNRCGTPLMEIVSEPDMRNIEEAVTYAKEIHRIVRAIGTSDADMEKGMMRFDINLSLRKPGQTKLPDYKVEVKNLNSFKSLEKAIKYEINRQTELLSRDEKIPQETRGFDDDKEITISQRSKEDSHDYRYFPEPDLPPLRTTQAQIEKIKAGIPELPLEIEEAIIEKWHLSAEDAKLITSDSHLSNLFTETVEKTGQAKTTLSLITILIGLLSEEKKELSQSNINPEKLIELVDALKTDQISFNVAKQILPDICFKNKTAGELIESMGLSQISDQSEIEKFCHEAIQKNSKSVEDYKNGKKQAIGPLVGYVMQQSQGKTNPKIVSQILSKLLS